MPGLLIGMARNAWGRADWHARNVENAGVYANEKMVLVLVVYYYLRCCR